MPPVTPLRGPGTCLGSVVTLTTALDPLKHLVLIYIFQVLFAGDSPCVSSEQEGEIEDTKGMEHFITHTQLIKY